MKKSGWATTSVANPVVYLVLDVLQPAGKYAAHPLLRSRSMRVDCGASDVRQGSSRCGNTSSEDY